MKKQFDIKKLVLLNLPYLLMGQEEEKRLQEEQAAQAELSKQRAKARYEKRKAEKREFTARKKAGLITPEEQAADEERRAKRRAWQKQWREKKIHPFIYQYK